MQEGILGLECEVEGIVEIFDVRGDVGHEELAVFFGLEEHLDLLFDKFVCPAGFLFLLED